MSLELQQALDRLPLVQAKVDLYRQLLIMKGEPTNREIDIMYLLSQDDDIRDILGRGFEKLTKGKPP